MKNFKRIHKIKREINHIAERLGEYNIMAVMTTNPTKLEEYMTIIKALNISRDELFDELEELGGKL